MTCAIYLSLYIYIFTYRCVYFDMSCFRAGGVHSLQTHMLRIPYT